MLESTYFGPENISLAGRWRSCRPGQYPLHHHLRVLWVLLKHDSWRNASQKEKSRTKQDWNAKGELVDSERNEEGEFEGSRLPGYII